MFVAFVSVVRRVVIESFFVCVFIRTVCHESFYPVVLAGLSGCPVVLSPFRWSTGRDDLPDLPNCPVVLPRFRWSFGLFRWPGFFVELIAVVVVRRSDFLLDRSFVRPAFRIVVVVLVSLEWGVWMRCC